jgi:hypothetical protein
MEGILEVRFNPCSIAMRGKRIELPWCVRYLSHIVLYDVKRIQQDSLLFDKSVSQHIIRDERNTTIAHLP